MAVETDPLPRRRFSIDFACCASTVEKSSIITIVHDALSNEPKMNSVRCPEAPWAEKRKEAVFRPKFEQ